MSDSSKKVFGILAEFSGSDTLLKAAGQIRGAGYSKFDCHSPFPIHGMDKSMGLGRSPLGYMIGIAGLAGLLGITLFIYWVSVLDYPLIISGKPLFSYQAFIPPIFAITILASAIMATLGMIALNKFPRLHHPLFSSEQFRRVTDGGFFVSVEADDPKFIQAETVALLKSIGATNVEVVKSK
ncbi:MAG: DUF3341 domain-containing protein [candidate division Zixibacteria bacterium]|nr:DUF3341 domain-containing protein [candidate division Zixibacteria bacterium]MDH3938193.1 DUF3341 domain-containing protein [candidate division Zixibacteria bacterium]MDH4034325.1 DUF3341 domain-containing protein [candidate division Zixibacteria bacterium]